MGKRPGEPGARRRSTPLLMDHGGGRRVVRLKGGDPFVFGRGSEEIEALRAAGVDYEVVPGSRSAFAVPAYAGVPVTHRGLSTSVTVVTGRRATRRPRGGGLGRPGSGGRHARDPDGDGAPGGSPPADRRRSPPRHPGGGGALGDHRPATGGSDHPRLTGRGRPARSLDHRDRPGGRPRPVMTAVEARRRRYRRRSGFAATPASVGRSDGGCHPEPGPDIHPGGPIAGLGGPVVELPVIAIEDAADGGAGLAESADRLIAGAYAWVAFTSANAVFRFLAALEGRAVPATVQWAAVGSATARRLAEGGFAPTLVPPEARAMHWPRHSRRPATPEPSRRSCSRGPRRSRDPWWPGSKPRDGRWTTSWPTERWPVIPIPNPSPQPGRPTRSAFTSSSTVERTVALLGVDGVPPVVVSIGPVTSASARAEGLQVTAEAIDSDIDGLVGAVVSALDPRPDPDARH